MDRRIALRVLGTIAGASLAPDAMLALGRRAHESASSNGAPHALSPSQHALVSVIAEQIIPRTDTPGAADAKVADFVDAMLGGWYEAGETREFLRALDAFDASVRHQASRPFASLDVSRQLQMLRALDDEAAAARASTTPRLASTAGDALQTHWFGTLKYLTVWGWATSRVVMTDVLHEWPLAGRYDPDAKIAAPRATGARP